MGSRNSQPSGRYTHEQGIYLQAASLRCTKCARHFRGCWLRNRLCVWSFSSLESARAVEWRAGGRPLLRLTQCARVWERYPYMGPKEPTKRSQTLPWGCRMLHSGGDTGNTSWRMSRSLPEGLRAVPTKGVSRVRCVLEKVSQAHFFIIEHTTQLDSQIIFARFLKLLLFYFWNLPVPDFEYFTYALKVPDHSSFIWCVWGHKTYFHLKLWLKHIPLHTLVSPVRDRTHENSVLLQHHFNLFPFM